MIDVLRSEWIKLRTIRMNWVLVVIAVAFPLVVSVLTAALTKQESFDAGDLLDVVQGTSVITALLLGVIGAATITGEFGFGTIRPTFAATPRRSVVIAAKAFVTVVVAMVVEAAVIVSAFLVAGAVAESRDRHISLGDVPSGKVAMLGLVLFAAIVSLLGYGLGLLIRNTPAAIAVLVLWPLVAEPLIGAILSVAGVEHPGKWLPYNSGLGMGLVLDEADQAERLGRLAAGLYFFAVTAVVTAIGAIVTRRRDA